MDLLQDREYTKVFAELMRRISTLEEEVRLYNIQAVEAQVHETELNDMYYPRCQQAPCYGYENQNQPW
jgi:phospholipid/cholesterol/gamma-HCH transport system substrate-binding protein